jgi:hypothetical protein
MAISANEIEERKLEDMARAQVALDQLDIEVRSFLLLVEKAKGEADISEILQSLIRLESLSRTAFGRGYTLGFEYFDRLLDQRRANRGPSSDAGSSRYYFD